MCLQPVHDQVLYRGVTNLEDDLLDTRSVADAHKGDNCLQCSKLYSLLLIVEHLEKCTDDGIGVKFILNAVGKLLSLEETDYQYVEQLLSHVPRVAIHKVG